MTDAERQAKMRVKRRAAGLCSNCGQRPAREGKQSCVLCFNCNCGREQNDGVCPHEEEKADNVRSLRVVS